MATADSLMENASEFYDNASTSFRDEKCDIALKLAKEARMYYAEINYSKGVSEADLLISRIEHPQIPPEPVYRIIVRSWIFELVSPLIFYLVVFLVFRGLFRIKNSYKNALLSLIVSIVPLILLASAYTHLTCGGYRPFVRCMDYAQVDCTSASLFVVWFIECITAALIIAVVFHLRQKKL